MYLPNDIRNLKKVEVKIEADEWAILVKKIRPLVNKILGKNAFFSYSIFIKVPMIYFELPIRVVDLTKDIKRI